MTAPTRKRLFDFGATSDASLTKKLLLSLAGPAGRLLSLERIDAVYQGIAPTASGLEFVDKALEAYGLSYHLPEGDLERIPKTGPLVVVANHPFGGIEGLFMAQMLGKARPDFKIMANYLLRHIPDLREVFIFVDPFGAESSTGVNVSPMKQALARLRLGGSLGVFPAGEVSSLNVSGRNVEDPAWSTTVARLVRRTKASVVPMHFSGRNSLLFQLAGLIHPRLRTALLPREFVNKTRKTVEVRIGNPIAPERLAAFSSDEALMDYLRGRTYLLKNRAERRAPRLKIFPAMPLPRQEALIPPVDAQLLHDEVAKLPPTALILESSEFAVLSAKAEDIPLTLREIGRLRELTFRRVGEGTGKSFDLDEFDKIYSHLFLFNRLTNEVVGAYRVGQTDVILREHGPQGLYTNTLFQLSSGFLERVNPALEMGRSFVRPEYQRSYSSLLMLWKGLSLLCVRDPRYHVLFGPVSISNDYRAVSRQLMANYFTSTKPSELADLVAPRSPLKTKQAIRQAASALINCEDDLNCILADLETEHKGLPVLLRQYLKLGGNLLAFNVDRDFSDCLDGLIVVDLLNTPPKQLERYMGKIGLRHFLDHHAAKREPTDCATRHCA